MNNRIATVITESELTDGSWKTLIQEAKRIRTPPNIIVVSSEPSWRLWADVLTSGGFDVLSPPFNPDTVTWMVQSACRRWQRAREIEEERRRNTLIRQPYY